MKYIIIFIFFIFSSNTINANELLIYLESAYKRNPVLNAERENYKAIKENINISRSEFLPSVSISGIKSSLQNSNKTKSINIANHHTPPASNYSPNPCDDFDRNKYIKGSTNGSIKSHL